MSAIAATAPGLPGLRAPTPRPPTGRAGTPAPPPPDLRRREPLAPLTTIRVGGPADWLCRARSTRTVTAALAWARAGGVAVAVLGKGSNLIVADEGFRGLVRLLSRPLQGTSGPDAGVGG